MGKSRRYASSLARARPWFKTRDGITLRSRLLRPADAPLLIDFFERLSSETRRRRFHTDVDRVDDDLIYRRSLEMTNVDNLGQEGAVIATVREEDGQEHIVGVARLARPARQPDHPEAEAAITVRDDFHGRGVGTELLRRMVLLAKQMQVKTILAVIEADNYPAIKLFRELDLPTETHTSYAETEMRIAVPA